MKTLKYIFRTFTALASVLLMTACQSDDFLWNGNKIASDEYVVAFQLQGYSSLEVSTRSDESRAAKVNDAYLLIFEDNGDEPATNALAKSPIKLNASLSNGIYSETFKKSELGAGRWYILVNPSSTISSALNSIANEQDFLDLKVDHSLDMTSDEPYVMCSKVRTVADEDFREEEPQALATVMEVHRLFSKVSLKINTSKVTNFVITGMELYRSATAGCIGGADASELAENPITSLKAPDTFVSVMDADGNTYNACPVGESMVTYTYPIDLDDAQENPVLVLSGCIRSLDENGSWVYTKESYYAVTLPSLTPGMEVVGTIQSVGGEGKTSITDAYDHRGSGITVEFKDEEKEINNIISDGQNVLAVPDTVYIPAAGASAGDKLFPINYRIKAGAENSVNVEFVNNKAREAEWLTLPMSVSGTAKGNPVSGLQEYTSYVGMSCDANVGSQREALVKVTLEDTELELTVVVIQKEQQDRKLSDSFKSISVSISGAGSDNASGLGFLAMIGGTGFNPTIVGIAADENGNRIRTKGLLAPIQKEGVTYTYEVKANVSGGAWNLKINDKCGAVLESGGTSGSTLSADHAWTISFPTGGDFNYATYLGAIVLEVDGSQYALDVYHTGFIHKEGTIWHYYEVYTDRNGRHWLDRNLGASSAGMFEASMLDNTTWPWRPGAKGDYFNSVTTTCPDGFRVPTFSEMQAMTSMGNFGVTSGAGYNIPSYGFEAMEYSATNPDGRQYTIHSYFPQARTKGGTGGQEKTGYYITSTPAGTANWYQVLTFAGRNVSSENINVNDNPMSLRCVDNTAAASAQSTYTIHVKGYTNVFLCYYDEASTEKIYLNAWPGQTVAIGSVGTEGDASTADGTLKRYNTYTFTSDRAFDYRKIYVIFNEVDANGNLVASNVSFDKRGARIGIPLKSTNCFYDRFAGSVAAGAEHGDWDRKNEPDMTTVIRWADYTEAGYDNVTFYNSNGDKIETSTVAYREGYRYVTLSDKKLRWEDVASYKYGDTSVSTKSGYYSQTTSSIALNSWGAGDMYTIRKTAAAAPLATTKVAFIWNTELGSDYTNLYMWRKSGSPEYTENYVGTSASAGMASTQETGTDGTYRVVTANILTQYYDKIKGGNESTVKYNITNASGSKKYSCGGSTDIPFVKDTHVTTGTTSSGTPYFYLCKPKPNYNIAFRWPYELGTDKKQYEYVYMWNTSDNKAYSSAWAGTKATQSADGKYYECTMTLTEEQYNDLSSGVNGNVNFILNNNSNRYNYKDDKNQTADNEDAKVPYTAAYVKAWTEGAPSDVAASFTLIKEVQAVVAPTTKTVGFRWSKNDPGVQERIYIWGTAALTNTVADGGNLATSKDTYYYITLSDLDKDANMSTYVKGFEYVRKWDSVYDRATTDVTWSSSTYTKESDALASSYGVDELYTLKIPNPYYMVKWKTSLNSGNSDNLYMWIENTTGPIKPFGDWNADNNKPNIANKDSYNYKWATYASFNKASPMSSNDYKIILWKNYNSDNHESGTKTFKNSATEVRISWINSAVLTDGTDGFNKTGGTVIGVFQIDALNN